MRMVIAALVAVLWATVALASGGPAWSYNRASSATNGPAQWAAIQDHEGEPAYPSCGLRSQSPINFVRPVVDASLGPLDVAWAPVSRLNVTNNGHTVQFSPLAGGGTAKDPSTGRSYTLLQLHFHSASEHLFGSSARDLEMHLVHQDAASGELFVIGVSFAESEVGFNAELANVWDAVQTATASGTVLDGRSLDLASIMPPSAAYYTYDGSLTTPPCSEGVRWVVMADPIGVSSNMLSAMRSALGTGTMSWPGVSSFVPRGNYRPAQPLNGRKVRAFYPTAGATTSGGAASAAAVDSAMRASIAGSALGAAAFVLAACLAIKVYAQAAPEKPAAEKYNDIQAQP